MSFETWMEEMSRGAPPPLGPPSQDFSGSLEDLLGGEAERGWWETALDWFSRPSRAVSEALGAYQEADKDPLEYALRGLKGEYEFGTVGEQLIPKSAGADYDPVEEFYKDAGRLAINIATDPVTWGTFSPGKAIVGVGVRQAGKIASKIPIPQAVGKLVLPSVTFLRRYGGRWGKQAAKRVDRMYMNQKTEAGKFEADLRDILRELGLFSSKAEPLHRAAMEHRRSGALRRGVIHEDPRVQRFAEFIRDNFDAMATRLADYRDAQGKGFLVLHPKLRGVSDSIKKLARKEGLMSNKNRGLRDDIWDRWVKGLGPDPSWTPAATRTFRAIEKKLAGYGDLGPGPSIWTKQFASRPFRALDDYIPQMLSEEFLTEISTQKGLEKATLELLQHNVPATTAVRTAERVAKIFSDRGFPAAAEHLARESGIPVVDAMGLLRKFGSPIKAGNIEYARNLKLPDEWLDLNPVSFMPRYFEKAWSRMTFGDEFFLSGEKLKSYMKDAVNRGGLDARWAENLTNVAMGKRPADHATDLLARRIMGFQVLTKMGPLSSLANLSQNINTVIREGGINFLRGVLRSWTDEGKRAGTIAYQRGIHDALMRLAGGQGTWVNRYLEWVGFTPVERLNRTLAANAGIVSVERLIKRYGRMTPELARRSVTNDDIARTVANGYKLPLDVADRVGFLSSEATQHATHWKDIPLYWQEPEFRVMLQYKSFIYQQTRFLLREVMGPAKQYFKTNGREGSIGPLIRASVAFGFGAEGVNAVRQAVRRGMGKVTGLEFEPREFDEDHPIWQLFEHSMYVGGLGIAGDLVERAARRDLKGWLLGPTIGDMSDLVEGGIISARAMTDPQKEVPFHRLMAEMMRRIPGIGTLLPRGKATSQQVEDFLDALR